MSSKKSDFGVFGLGVMGSSISLNIADKGYELSVYNRADAGEEEVVNNFMLANPDRSNIKGFTDLKLFIDSMAETKKDPYHDQSRSDSRSCFKQFDPDAV